jgi:hypothetical protein
VTSTRSPAHERPGQIATHGVEPTPGRSGWSPTQTPHRSGLARLTHPAPHPVRSLPWRSVVVAWTGFRPQRTDPVSLPRCTRRCPLPSPGSLGSVPLAQRYYGTLRPPDSRFAALRFLRLAIPRSVCDSSPFGLRREADGSSRSLLYRLLPSRSSSRNCQDLPSSRGTLVTIRPVLRPRRDRIRGMGPRSQRIRHGPRLEAQRGLSTFVNFGAQSHGFWSGCLRFAEMVAHRHARLASGCWSPLDRTGFEPAGFL